MTERRARFIDRLLEEHDQQAPTCGGTLDEVVVKPAPSDESLRARVLARCGGCGSQWSWHEPVLALIQEGRGLGLS